MTSTITVHNIDPGVKSWVDSQAHYCGVLMDEFVYSLIHEYCAKDNDRIKPSESFKLYFDIKHGVGPDTTRTLRLQDGRTP